MTRKQYGGLIGALILVLSIYDATLGLTIRGGMLGVLIAQATTFLGLTDTPSTYTGQANKVVSVKGDQTGLEFTTPNTSFLGLTDVPDSYTGQANKLVTVKSDVSGVEFTTPPASELLANKNQPNGYIGANANGRVGFTGAGDYAAHSALSVSSTITPTQRTMGIEGTAPGTNLTSNPNIAACTYPGQPLTLHGISANTVIIEDENVDAGSGVYLCGRTGSAIVGQGSGDLNLECNNALIWEETGCKTLQRIANLGSTIDKPGTQLSLRDGNSGFDLKVTAGKAILECIASGASCDNEWVVPSGKLGMFFSDTTEVARLTQTTNAWDFLAGHLHLRGGTGAPTGTDCDAAGEARRVWVQTDGAIGRKIWICKGAAGWEQEGVHDIGTRVTRTAAQTIPTSTDTAVAFDAEDYDTDTMHSTSSNTSRLTMTTAGKYLIICGGRFEANANGLRDSYIRKNGTTIIGPSYRQLGSTAAIFLNTSVIDTFAANDYVEFLLFQDSGGDLIFERSAGRYPLCTAQKVN